TRPDGITAPTWSGFSIQERRKRTSSSRRSGFFTARAEDGTDIDRPQQARAGGLQFNKKRYWRGLPASSRSHPTAYSPWRRKSLSPLKRNPLPRVELRRTTAFRI